MTVLAQWKTGALPTVTGDVTSDGTVGVPTSPALKVGSTAGAAFARWSFTSANKIALRFYVRTPSAWTSSSFPVVAFRPTGGTTSLGIAFAGTGAPGQVRLTKTGGSAIASSPNNTLAVGADYCVEAIYDTATTSAVLRVRALGSDTWLWTSSVVDAALDTALTIVDVGRPNSSPVTTLWIDSVVIATAETDLGPDADEVITPSLNNRARVWDGTALVWATAYWWDGTSLQDIASIGVWDGTDVVPTATS